MESWGNVSTSYDEFSSALSITWLVPDYTYFDDNINSPSFGSTDILTADTYPYKWHITAHPNGSRRQFQGFVSMYLYSDNCCTDGSAPATSVKIKMSISRCYDGMKSSFSQCHDLKTFDSTSGGFGFHRFISRSYLLDPENHFLSPEGVLEVCIKIKHLSFGTVSPSDQGGNNQDGTIFSLNQNYPDKKDIDLASFVHLSSDLASAFEDMDERFCDVTLLLEGRTREIKANKGILVARSPVFRAMFSNKMVEEKASVVDIPDIPFDVMKALIKYIYSGSINEDVEDNVNFVIRLFSAADKYGLKHLKRLCESYICSNVTMDCVAFAMIAGHLHNSNAIKVTCFNLISREDCKTKEIEDWSEVHKFQSLIDEMVDYWKDQHVQLGKKNN